MSKSKDGCRQVATTGQLTITRSRPTATISHHIPRGGTILDSRRNGALSLAEAGAVAESSTVVAEMLLMPVSEESEAHDATLNGSRVDRPNAVVVPADNRPEDLSILHDTRRGDLDSFHILVDRYKNRLFRFIRPQIGDEQLAEDLVQEILVRVFKAARKGSFHDARPSLAPWVFTIAKNCIIDHQRSHQREARHFQKPTGRREGCDRSVDVADPRSEDSSQTAAKTELLQNVHAALQQLPEEQREVIRLKVFAQLTFDEIAECLSIPTATAKSRMRYGLEKIRTALGPIWSPEG